MNEGDIVYVVMEDYYYDEKRMPCFRYKIEQCVIEKLPQKWMRTKEYKLETLSKPKELLFVGRDRIHLTRHGAIEEAERVSDRYDFVWEKIEGKKIDRPWREHEQMELKFGEDKDERDRTDEGGK